jgi:hypothetical protein
MKSRIDLSSFTSVCEICGSSFRSETGLLSHMKYDHPSAAHTNTQLHSAYTPTLEPRSPPLLPPAPYHPSLSAPFSSLAPTLPPPVSHALPHASSPHYSYYDQNLSAHLRVPPPPPAAAAPLPDPSLRAPIPAFTIYSCCWCHQNYHTSEDCHHHMMTCLSAPTPRLC